MWLRVEYVAYKSTGTLVRHGQKNVQFEADRSSRMVGVAFGSVGDSCRGRPEPWVVGLVAVHRPHLGKNPVSYSFPAVQFKIIINKQVYHRVLRREIY